MAALGKVDYRLKIARIDNIKFRRSLYFVKNIKKGEVVTNHHVRSIRPGYGISPKYLDEIIGKKTSQKIVLGTAVSWDHIAK